MGSCRALEIGVGHLVAVGERVVAAKSTSRGGLRGRRAEPHVRMLDRFLVIAEGNELPSRAW